MEKILKDILKAREIIAAKIYKTPLIFSKNTSRGMGINLYFKPEIFQRTGSFKIRGILNKLHYLKTKERKRGVITFSAGDHALSLAYATSRMGIPLVVLLPQNTPTNKIRAIRNYGAEITLSSGSLRAECEEIQRKRKLTMIHPFDDPVVIAGHGTIGLEILEELPNVNMVFVPVGGGGLISGIAAALKLKNQKIKIVGVEPHGAPTMSLSIKQNKIIYLKERQTIATALASPFIGKNTLKYARKYVDNWLLVSDAEILTALRLLWTKHQIKIEPAGAAALAAIIFEKIKIPTNSNVVCLLSGGKMANKLRRQNGYQIPRLGQRADNGHHSMKTGKNSEFAFLAMKHFLTCFSGQIFQFVKR